jgi:hypothetical protein
MDDSPFKSQGITADNLGLEITLEGPDGEEYKEKIDSAARFEQLGLYVPGSLTFPSTP